MLKELKRINANDIASGLVTGLMMYVFACVFSTIIFGEAGLSEAIPLGIGIHVITVFVCGLSFSFFSELKISIAGPDVNATVFFATMAIIIRDAIVIEEQTSYPSLLPTIISGIVIGTASVTVLFLILGYLNLTRVVQFMPASVLSGFLAAVGYIVLVKAKSISVGKYKVEEAEFWYLLTPAVLIGIILFIFKKYKHYVMLIPLILFYIILYGSGSNIDEARKQGWFLEEFSSTSFKDNWVWEFGYLDQIDLQALGKAIPTLLVMLLVVTVDFLLKLAGSRKSLDFHNLSYNHEMILAGKTNFILLFCCGIPGYSQLNFTLLNHSIIQNTESRIPGIICALFNGILFFVGYPIINVFPRFFLGSVLFFEALSFFVENLWDIRNKIAVLDYLAVWIILITSALTSIVIAVIVGIILAALIFAIQYAQTGVIRAIISGSDYQSSVVRSAQEDRKLEHLGTQCLIIVLSRFIFFGSASQVQDLIKSLISEQTVLKQIGRVKYFVIDWEHVYGIDYTASGVFFELIQQLRLVKSDLYVVIFTGMKDSIKKQLQNEGVLDLLYDDPKSALILSQSINIKNKVKQNANSNIHDENLPYSDRRCFDTLDLGMEWVEEKILEHASLIRRKWLYFDSFRRLHDHARLQAQHEAFEHVLGGHLGDMLWKYVTPLEVPKGFNLCTAGEVNPNLYLLQRGRLTTYMEKNNEKLVRLQSLRRGAFVNADALFVDMPVSHTIIADVDCKVLALSRIKLQQLEEQHPDVAFEIHRNVLRHTARTRDKLARELEAVDNWLKADADDNANTKGNKHHNLANTNNQVNVAKTSSTIGARLKEAVDSAVLQFETSDTNANDINGRLLAKRLSRRNTGIGNSKNPTSILKTRKSKNTTAVKIQNDNSSNDNNGSDDEENGSGVGVGDEENNISFRKDLHYFRHFHFDSPLPTISIDNGSTKFYKTNDENSSINTSPKTSPKTSPVAAHRKRYSSGGSSSPTITWHEQFAKKINESPKTKLNTKKIKYKPTLSETKKIDAIGCFTRAVNSLEPRNRNENSRKNSNANNYYEYEVDEENSNTLNLKPNVKKKPLLPRSMLRETLMDMGFFPSEIELDKLIRETRNNKLNDNNRISQRDFVKLVTKLSLADLSEAQINEFSQVFIKYATVKNPNQEELLGVEELSKLMAEFGHPEEKVVLRRLIAEWSRLQGNFAGRAIGFNSFCSMLANILKMELLDEQVEKDWAKFCNPHQQLNEKMETQLVNELDIMRVLPHISQQDALHMIWESNVDSKEDGIDFNDFIDSIQTVWDSEITPHVNNSPDDFDFTENTYHASIRPDEYLPIAALVKRGIVQDENNDQQDSKIVIDDDAVIIV